MSTKLRALVVVIYARSPDDAESMILHRRTGRKDSQQAKTCTIAEMSEEKAFAKGHRPGGGGGTVGAESMPV